MGHYYDKSPVGKSKELEIEVKINNQVYKFITDNNVFSKKRLDYGTRVLLETLDLNKIKGKVLDFGCGYGPIGIYLAKNTKALIDMIDINERCLKLAYKNAKLNKVKVNVFASDKYLEVNTKYDYIITNPPIRIGQSNLFEILIGAKEHLNKNGQLWLVINKNQGAKTIIKKLELSYLVRVICKKGGFYVICATKD